MAGYSGTPLTRKLGIKPGARIALPGIPDDVRSELEDVVTTCVLARVAPFDFVLCFVDSRAKLEKEFGRWSERLRPDGGLWIAWRKKTSGVNRDVDGNVVRHIGLAAGLVDVKVCAISEAWSALKFVFRVRDRPGR